MEIVFVVLHNFQEYVLDNIENCRRFHNSNITVLCDEQFVNHFDDKCNVVTVESLIDGYKQYTNNLKELNESYIFLPKSTDTGINVFLTVHLVPYLNILMIEKKTKATINTIDNLCGKTS